MSYEYFSYLYDELMDEAPYDQWLEFFEKQKCKYLPNAKRIMDLACGTGEVTLRLHERGYHVVGVDLSEEMLSVAQNKAFQKGFHIPFYHQDMAQLEGLEGFDAVVIFCDSLNYLMSEKQVRSTFHRVYNALRDEGLFIFDVHSPHKITNGFINRTFAFNGDKISYIWNSFPFEHPLSVEHELTFFVYDEETDQYERFDELHKQRTFEMWQYKKWVEEAGFKIHSITGDFTDLPANENHDRIFFTLQK